MGVATPPVKGTIHVDTSFASGECQSGYIIDIGGENLKGYSPVFRAENNNDAEIMGILLACKVAVDFYGYHNEVDCNAHYYFTVHNDNITAMTVSDSKYKPSPKARGKHESTRQIHEWCDENRVTLKCIRKKRSHVLMKKCDRLSKTYRKNRKKKGWN